MTYRKLLWAAALALGLSAAAQPAAAQPVKAKVETGVLAGEAQGGVAVFRNVPFAAPPVGPLRWKPPVRPAAWTGERPALENGPSCPQAMNANGANGGGARGRTSEDCLLLNVFAPVGARKAPVMVWIHGGANVAGSGGIYDGAAFARDGVVLFAVNYRLGPLGFFAHPALTAEAKAGEPVANYAYMDQIAALQWVQRNAAAFGGDPANVTVFGESAGAMDIVALLGMPAAKGLFNRAIMESNIGWGTGAPLAQAEQRGVAAAQRWGLSATASAAELRALPVEALIGAGAGGGAAGTTIDGRLVKESAYQAFAAGRGLDVPIVIGSNSYEASLAAARGPQTPEAAAAFTDGQAGAPARWIAARHAAGQPAWLYYFSYVRESQRATAPGAAHASEIAFVFDRLRGEPTPADQALASLMHSCWVAFAKAGKPACASGPAWPAYSPQTDQLMEFGLESGVRTGFRKPQLDALEARQAALGPTGVRPPAPAAPAR